MREPGPIPGMIAAIPCSLCTATMVLFSCGDKHWWSLLADQHSVSSHFSGLLLIRVINMAGLAGRARLLPFACTFCS